MDTPPRQWQRGGWAIEDCRHVSGHLEHALQQAGERVVRVAPRLTGQIRRGEREIGKSDQIDARAIARAVIREGVDRFPTAFLDEAAMDVRLTDHRAELTTERTRLSNWLRWHLVVLCPDVEATIRARQLDDRRQLDRIARRLRALERSARARIALDHVARIRTLTRDAARSSASCTTSSPRTGPSCSRGRLRPDRRRYADWPHRRAPSCSPPTPASPVTLASHPSRHPPDPENATASTAAATANSTALHVIAITRARLDPATSDYLARKQAESKTRTEHSAASNDSSPAATPQSSADHA
ncbi:transposase [Conexibacter stalactiti]|uniref:Transposase n=1 Tax=Conexibacter stalactiti TaxID=1940611 RepID=A0ABU4HRH1_9ACTN|nr:transposase [Conexibacter stalactiti]MDW5595928.1 transposase [Conexibacter stalactiti]MEC5036570.1 transposase [Conexibacter stalactiti]